MGEAATSTRQLLLALFYLPWFPHEIAFKRRGVLLKKKKKCFAKHYTKCCLRAFPAFSSFDRPGFVISFTP